MARLYCHIKRKKLLRANFFGNKIVKNGKLGFKIFYMWYNKSGKTLPAAQRKNFLPEMEAEHEKLPFYGRFFERRHNIFNDSLFKRQRAFDKRGG